ncbi:MAG: M23 family metallopeptidase, partial [Candidatus Altiarchaeum hamiconexum]|nr:M23 family metallopeptidase [Candidatus Altarchaeum hamiconexum]
MFNLYFHKDLAKGDSVHSAFDGVVRVSRYFSGYGNIVVVRHYNGLETCYAHLSKLIAKVNQMVKTGEVLGLGGRTGRATCDHLHFEVRYLEEPINPRLVFDFENQKL